MRHAKRVDHVQEARSGLCWLWDSFQNMASTIGVWRYSSTVLWTFLIGTERNLGFPTEPSVETPERVAEEEAKAVEET